MGGVSAEDTRNRRKHSSGLECNRDRHGERCSTTSILGIRVVHQWPGWLGALAVVHGTHHLSKERTDRIVPGDMVRLINPALFWAGIKPITDLDRTLGGAYHHNHYNLTNRQDFIAQRAPMLVISVIHDSYGEYVTIIDEALMVILPEGNILWVRNESVERLSEG